MQQNVSCWHLETTGGSCEKNLQYYYNQRLTYNRATIMKSTWWTSVVLRAWEFSWGNQGMLLSLRAISENIILQLEPSEFNDWVIRERNGPVPHFCHVLHQTRSPSIPRGRSKCLEEGIMEQSNIFCDSNSCDHVEIKQIVLILYWFLFVMMMMMIYVTTHKTISFSHALWIVEM